MRTPDVSEEVLRIDLKYRMSEIKKNSGVVISWQASALRRIIKEIWSILYSRPAIRAIMRTT
jgi:hypothetical protein